MIAIASKEKTGSLGIPHLERFWLLRMASREGGAGNQTAADWVAEFTLLSGLKLAQRETYEFLLCSNPSFEQFEQWILEKNGGALDPERMRRLKASLDGSEGALKSVRFPSAPEPVLSGEDLAFWDANGYVVLHGAVSPEQSQAAAQAIYDFIGMDPNDPGTWYHGPQGSGIWVPLIHHPALWANRESPRIHRAFAQLWGRDDLWVSVDQAGVNPPQRKHQPHFVQGLHFDVSLAPPVPFGVQGILYLTDTAAEQGAFTCVPGFHKRVDSWVANLPAGANPRTQDLTKLGAVSIAGRAGDLVIWHHALPHGASLNRTGRPRVVQYIKMLPSVWDYNPVWL